MCSGFVKILQLGEIISWLEYQYQNNCDWYILYINRIRINNCYIRCFSSFFSVGHVKWGYYRSLSRTDRRWQLVITCIYLFTMFYTSNYTNKWTRESQQLPGIFSDRESQQLPVICSDRESGQLPVVFSDRESQQLPVIFSDRITAAACDLQ